MSFRIATRKRTHTGAARHTVLRLLAAGVLLLVFTLGAGAAPTRAEEPPPTPALSLIVPHGRNLMDAATWQPFEVRGVNYTRPSVYPPECSDLHFGGVNINALCPWDSATITDDMRRLQARGVNTVRVFLNFYAFGGFKMNNPDYNMEPALQHLDEFIAIANRHQIYVLPVLLAKYPQDSHFEADDFWFALNAHVQPIIERFANRPGILAWDLFNEPDIAGPVDVRCWDWDNSDFPLCFNLATQRLLFLNMLHDEVKQRDPLRPVTISVAFAKSYFKPEGAYAVRLADLVDFYSVHYYDNDPYDSGRYAQHWYYGAGLPADLERSIDELDALGLNKPTVLTEVGFPSGPGTLRTLDEAHRDLRTVLQTSRNRQIAGIVLWPFQDTPETLVHDLFW